MRRLFIVMLAVVALTGCASIDHPYDDPGRDECARQAGHGVLTRNCPH